MSYSLIAFYLLCMYVHGRIDQRQRERLGRENWGATIVSMAFVLLGTIIWGKP